MSSTTTTLDHRHIRRVVPWPGACAGSVMSSLIVRVARTSCSAASASERDTAMTLEAVDASERCALAASPLCDAWGDAAGFTDCRQGGTASSIAPPTLALAAALSNC